MYGQIQIDYVLTFKNTVIHRDRTVHPKNGLASPVTVTSKIWTGPIRSDPTEIMGAHRNIVITLGIEKLEWCGYLVVKF